MLRALSVEEVAIVSGGMMDDDSFDNDNDGGGGNFDYDVSQNNTTYQLSDGTYTSDDIVVTAPTSGSGVNWGALANTLDQLGDSFGNAEEVGVVVTGAAGVGAFAQLGLDVPNDIAAAAAAAATGGMALGKLTMHFSAGEIRALALQ